MARLLEGRDDDYGTENTESDECSSTTGTSLNGDNPAPRVIKIVDEQYVPSIRSPSPLLDRHLNVEISSLKSQIRNLQNQLHAKDEELFHLDDRLKEKEDQVQYLSEKNVVLTRDATEAKILRDEVDALKQKLEKLEKYEGENKRMKEKIDDLEIIQKDYQILKSEMDEQKDKLHRAQLDLEKTSRRARSEMEREGRISEQDKDIRNLNDIITKKNGEIEKLIGDVARIQALYNEQSSRISEMEKELNDSSFFARESLGNSLLEEMNDSKRSEITDLRNENIILKTRLESNDHVSVEWKDRAERAERSLEDQKEGTATG
ncbi:hypothetical protein PENTCL1PPCAC_30236 [Pristionchus entomophagus]|uniref:Uncharacterized protein n=1 Tax=Pristionchus entomophagus TaxID=358040 RepID=A0AAV5UM13_9BILA|nr:hypothetical protein PENTCL1PPCAC_30236 [Pristionchus entomophagus]